VAATKLECSVQTSWQADQHFHIFLLHLLPQLVEPGWISCIHCPPVHCTPS